MKSKGFFSSFVWLVIVALIVSVVGVVSVVESSDLISTKELLIQKQEYLKTIKAGLHEVKTLIQADEIYPQEMRLDRYGQLKKLTMDELLNVLKTVQYEVDILMCLENKGKNCNVKSEHSINQTTPPPTVALPHVISKLPHAELTVITTEKANHTAPAAPTMASRNTTSITLTADSKMEFRRDSGKWQSSNVFSGLTAGTSYAFTRRVKETKTHNASPASVSATFITDKNNQTAPVAPKMSTRTPTSITLTSDSKMEFRRDSGAWQSSNVFTGLVAGTSYTFTRRVKETKTHNASPASVSITIITDKHNQTAPNAPTMASRNSTSITLTADSKMEFRRGSGKWQSSNVFSGLTAETSYNFTRRAKESSTHHASPASPLSSLSTLKTHSTTLKTEKNNQTAPTAPTMASRTTTSITLTADSKMEFRRGSGAWQSSNVFTGLVAGTSYTFTRRVKETNTHHASPASVSTTIITEKHNQTAPSAPTMASRNATSITLTADSKMEFRRGSGKWQSSNVFSGLTAETSYNFTRRVKESQTHHASPSSPLSSLSTLKTHSSTPSTPLKTEKNNQTAPAAPKMSTRTPTSITLTADSKMEFRRGSGKWQESNVFSDLIAGTSYNFTRRVKETATHHASPSSTLATFITDKHNQTAPSAPTMASRTTTSITLAADSKMEFRRDNGAWQKSNVFSGLVAGFSYTFTRRVKETKTHHASPSSVSVTLKADKHNQTAPSAPTMLNRTTTTITLTADSTMEFRRDNGAWQKSNVFSGLVAGTSYNFARRIKETTTRHASPHSPSTTLLTLKTEKLNQTAPTAPTMASRTTKSITLAADSKMEFRRDNGAWQSSNVFNGLFAGSSHTFTRRVKETTTHYASPSSVSVTLKADKYNQTAPKAPTSASITTTTITLTADSTMEFRRDNRAWQTSNVFSGLVAGTSYNFTRRIKETITRNASPASPAIVLTTLKTEKINQSAPTAPTMASRTTTSITLTADSKMEFRRDNGAWQSSNVFNGLLAGSSYNFARRVKETSSHYASPPSVSAKLRADKHNQTAPTAPTSASITTTTITLTADSTMEFRRGNGAWQDSNVFSGLVAGTSYNFTRRIKETTTRHASPHSPSTTLVTLKTEKLNQSAPTAPTMASRTTKSITLAADSKMEFRRDNGAWQSSNVFNGLFAGSSHTFTRRVKETSTHYASPSSVSVTLKADKNNQTAPAAPTMSSRTTTSITLTADSKMEFRRDNGSWQTSNVFSGLVAGTSYKFTRRARETTTSHASPASTEASFKTLQTPTA